MTEQDRNLIDGNAGQQHLNCEGVAEHMAVATLWRAVRSAEIGDFEESTIGALPVGGEGFGQAITGPKKNNSDSA